MSEETVSRRQEQEKAKEKALLKLAAKAAAKAELGLGLGLGKPKTKIKETIFDGIVSVNSLFTVAVFLGLAFNPAQQSIDTNPHCEAGTTTTKRLVIFEVVSFSCFLFSSIVAHGLKMELTVLTLDNRHLELSGMKFGMWCSGISSVIGCVFLIVSIVHVIEIRLGALRCGGNTLVTVLILCLMSAVGLWVYIFAAWNVLKPRLGLGTQAPIENISDVVNKRR